MAFDKLLIDSNGCCCWLKFCGTVGQWWSLVLIAGIFHLKLLRVFSGPEGRNSYLANVALSLYSQMELLI